MIDKSMVITLPLIYEVKTEISNHMNRNFFIHRPATDLHTEVDQESKISGSGPSSKYRSERNP